MDFNFDVLEMMSHVMDWVDVIGTTGHTLLDIFFGVAVGGGSLFLLVSYMFHEGRH
jgi:hypothetical protein